MMISPTTAREEQIVPEVLNCTDYQVFDDRGHSLVFDHGCEKVAYDMLRWIRDRETGLDTAAGAVSTVSRPSA